MTVAVGFCYGQTTVTPQWRRSYTHVLMRDAGSTRRIVGEFAHEVSGVHIPKARCDIAQDFLDHPAKPDWLWLIDTDATFADDTLDRLIAAADPVERPIVGALAFGVRPQTDATGTPVMNAVGAWVPELFPTIFVYQGNETGCIENYPRDQVVQCHATGAHCLLIHRTVLADERWQDGHPLPWFRSAVWGTHEVSEDHFFCMKAGSLGYPVHVDTSIKTGHVKTFIADEDMFLAMQASRPAPPEPATEKVAVIVPVLNRPDNAAPFMASLWATTRLTTVYAVCSNEVDEHAWAKAGAFTVWSDGITFPQKVNAAYEHTTEPWIFLCGDDVEFHPGWLDHAMQTARTTGARVIGTNDLGNPRVRAGQHATHMLITRSYIDEVGASWDGPGVVCHEGYRHWFVDDEIITAAKQRGEWAPCLTSIVEHMHPEWGKGEMDNTYRKGTFRSAQDHKLFQERYAAQAVPA